MSPLCLVYTRGLSDFGEATSLEILLPGVTIGIGGEREPHPAVEEAAFEEIPLHPGRYRVEQEPEG